jgi:signal transduction histidine kinase
LSGIQARAQKLTPFRTMVEGRGHRRDGSAFFAQVWLSTYRTTSGPRLAAIIWDASEQVREREELGLRQLLTSSRIFMGAISHEVRNLCAAISVVHLNLSKNSEFAENPDFQALGSLVESLRQLASSELRSATESDLSGTDLRGLLEELGIIAGPSAEELEAEIDWEIPEELPFVRADRSALLQVLLNLLNNGLRAVRAQQERRISVVVYALQDSVVVRICNRGPVIEAPQDLFQPFQSGADATGLGLYVSRAIVRTFGGELRYTSEPNRHCFLVELMSAPAHEGPRG